MAALAAEGDARPDQISVGPVWETPTKEGRPAAGMELIEYAPRRGDDPLVRDRGDRHRRTSAEVVAAGAERVVVVRAIRDAEDPEAAARELRAALRRAGRVADG